MRRKVDRPSLIELFGLFQAAQAHVADAHAHLENGHIGVLIGQGEDGKSALGQVQGVVEPAPLTQDRGAPGLENGPADGGFTGVRDPAGAGNQVFGPVQQMIDLIEVAQQDVGIHGLAQNTYGLVAVHLGQDIFAYQLAIIIKGGGIGGGVEVEVAHVLQTNPLGALPRLEFARSYPGWIDVDL